MFESRDFYNQRPSSLSENDAEQKEQYGEILYDRSKNFHGISFDLLRLKSILEKGILSESAAAREKTEINRNYGGYNKNENISVAVSPCIHATFDYGCFKTYIKNGISFVIANEELATNKGAESGFIDEGFIQDKVEKENIVGITVPEDDLNSPLGDLTLSINVMGGDYIKDRCLSFIGNLTEETGYEIDTSELTELLKSKEDLDKRTEKVINRSSSSEANDEDDYFDLRSQRETLTAQLDKLLTSYMEKAYGYKLQLEKPSLRDALKLYAPPSMRIYNSKGFEISL